MATTAHAIRYPVATTGAGNIDALNRVLADLCTRGNPKDGAALTLRQLVEEEARDLSGEAFALFMYHLYERITTFLDSNEVSENLGALRAIDELIDVTISENASKVAKFSNYMQAAFETKRDPEIFVLASKVLGHIARSVGAMTADEVECQVKVALEVSTTLHLPVNQESPEGEIPSLRSPTFIHFGLRIVALSKQIRERFHQRNCHSKHLSRPEFFCHWTFFWRWCPFW